MQSHRSEGTRHHDITMHSSRQGPVSLRHTVLISCCQEFSECLCGNEEQPLFFFCSAIWELALELQVQQHSGFVTRSKNTVQALQADGRGDCGRGPHCVQRGALLSVKLVHTASHAAVRTET